MPCKDFVDPSACYDAVVAELRAAGAVWNPKLTRGCAGPGGVPGIVAREPLLAGELLCQVPARLHLSPRACRAAMPRLFQACDGLPSASAERREEAAQAAAVALLLLRAAAPERAAAPAANERPSPLCDEAARAPALWHRCAEGLLSQDFSGHPYRRWLSDSGGLRGLLAPSGELAHVRAQAEYVQVVFGCLQQCLGEEARFGSELFLQAWLCLLTRKFSSPHGSVFVPGVDFFNHAACPGAAGDWDEAGEAVVVRACRAHEAQEEVCIAYGELSNPLLLRTYGFTVPPACEPCWTCTFEEHELTELCRTDGPAGPPLAEHFAALPNVHLDAALVTETLASVLEVCAMEGGSAGALLRELCTRRSALYEQDGRLAGPLAALRRAREAGACGGGAAWWACWTLATALPEEQQDALRVKMSEYLCVVAHLEALDLLAGRVPEGSCLARAAGLREDLRALMRAGLLGAGF